MSNKNYKEEESTIPSMEFVYPYNRLQMKHSRTIVNGQVISKHSVGKLAKNVFNDENESETPKLNSKFKLVFGGFKQKEWKKMSNWPAHWYNKSTQNYQNSTRSWLNER